MDFQEDWQFPNCVRAVDGKHVMMDKPANSGSINYNYKGYCSIVLMAVVDAKCRLRFIIVGSHGQESDGGVWAACDLGTMLEAQDHGGPQMPPDPEALPGSATSLPHVLVGDEAFPLRPYLMRPFPGSRLTDDTQRVFNYRLSRARRTSENAFGILAQRWRVYRGPIGCSVETTKLIVQATCMLHNFLREKDVQAQRTGPGCYSCIAPEKRGEAASLGNVGDVGATHNHTRDAAQVRDKYVEYFNGVGSVAWQLESIRR